MSKPRTTSRALAAMALATAAVTGPLAVEANAATVVPASCAYGVAATRTPASNAPVTKTCFATFSQALSFATGGRVTVPRSATTVSSATLAAAGVVGPDAVQPLLGIEYQDANYGGGGDVYYGNNGSGCSGGTVYGFPTVKKDNTYSSSRGFSGCGGTHYQYTNYGGATLPCNNDCSNLGLLNDKTSSIVYR